MERRSAARGRTSLAHWPLLERTQPSRCPDHDMMTPPSPVKLTILTLQGSWRTGLSIVHNASKRALPRNHEKKCTDLWLQVHRPQRFQSSRHLTSSTASQVAANNPLCRRQHMSYSTSRRTGPTECSHHRSDGQTRPPPRMARRRRTRRQQQGLS